MDFVELYRRAQISVAFAPRKTLSGPLPYPGPFSPKNPVRTLSGTQFLLDPGLQGTGSAFRKTVMVLAGVESMMSSQCIMISQT